MSEKKPEFQFRAFVSVLSGLSLLVMILSGLILFFAPSGRLARDTAWLWWGLGRFEWIALHICFSLLFAVACVFHVYLNLRAIKRYFQGQLTKKWAFRPEWIAALLICVAIKWAFRPEWIAALLICVAIFVGVLRSVAPFDSLMDLRWAYKHMTVQTSR
jgi:hypothetical protein